MSLQFVSGVYVMLTYLTSYLFKLEHAMSELMKKASKRVFRKNIKDKCVILVIYF